MHQALVIGQAALLEAELRFLELAEKYQLDSVIDRTQLQRRARRKLVDIERRRSDERYQRVMGRFIAEGLLHTNQNIAEHRAAIHVEDVLWAGEVEPRLLELLPALIVKRPSMFVDVVALPEDLAACGASRTELRDGAAGCRC